jgi:hypothetical protein
VVSVLVRREGRPYAGIGALPIELEESYWRLSEGFSVEPHAVNWAVHPTVCPLEPEND